LIESLSVRQQRGLEDCNCALFGRRIAYFSMVHADETGAGAGAGFSLNLPLAAGIAQRICDLLI
jgi:hypothetical protein